MINIMDKLLERAIEDIAEQAVRSAMAVYRSAECARLGEYHKRDNGEEYCMYAPYKLDEAVVEFGAILSKIFCASTVGCVEAIKLLSERISEREAEPANILEMYSAALEQARVIWM